MYNPIFLIKTKSKASQMHSKTIQQPGYNIYLLCFSFFVL